MKKSIVTITFICLCIAAFAQKTYHSSNLDKFVGKWIYNKDGKQVEIILRVASKKVVNQDVTIDVIEGFHIYKRDNKVIDNSFEKNKTSLNAGFIEDRDNPNLLKISFFDELKQKSGDALITFIPGNPEKIKWVLINSEGLRIRKKGEAEFDKTFTVPEYVILEKEK